MFGLENSANNFGASAGLLANTLANRPVQAALGTLFIGTNNLILYRYNGVAWTTIAGGGIAGATNGLQVIGTNIGLGGTLTQNTNISCFGSFTFRIESFLRFDIGNGSELGFTVDNTNLLTYSRSAVGNAVGIILDYNIQDYKLGDQGGGTYFQAYAGINELRTFVQGNTYGLNCVTNYVKIGDWSGAGTNLSTTYDFATNRVSNFSTDGYYNFANIPVYANNAAALGGGLLVGDLYRVTGTGNLHIVF